MSPDQQKQVFMTLVTVVAIGGFSLSHELESRRQEDDFRRLEDTLRHSREQQTRFNDDLVAQQRKLGCRGEVTLGICMDPPCEDSDATAGADQRYVRGSVTFFAPMGPHQTVEDTCMSASDLREGTCASGQDGGALQPEWVIVHCDKGCRDGACVR